MAFLIRRQIIPPGWEEKHRPILDTAMTAFCEIRGPFGDYDYDTGEQAPGELLAANIPCRVHGLAAGRGGQPSNQFVDLHSVDVIVPIEQLPELDITDKGPILTVTGYMPGHAGDPHLIGLPLRITNLHPATLQWERILTATMEV